MIAMYLIALLAVCSLFVNTPQGVILVPVGSYKVILTERECAMSQLGNPSRPVDTKSKLNYRTAVSPRLPVVMEFPENSPFTKQEFKDEADINILMQRYQNNGEIPAINQRAPQFLDATCFDYQKNMEQIAEANSIFAELPSSMRNRFENDPGKFLAFCGDPANRAEMADMGLLRDPNEWVDMDAAVAYQNRSKRNLEPSANVSNSSSSAPSAAASSGAE